MKPNNEFHFKHRLKKNFRCKKTTFIDIFEKGTHIFVPIRKVKIFSSFHYLIFITATLFFLYLNFFLRKKKKIIPFFSFFQFLIIFSNAKLLSRKIYIFFRITLLHFGTPKKKKNLEHEFRLYFYTRQKKKSSCRCHF